MVWGERLRNAMIYHAFLEVLCKYVFDVCKVKFVMGRNLQLWSLLRPVKRTACRASFHGVLVF